MPTAHFRIRKDCLIFPHSNDHNRPGTTPLRPEGGGILLIPWGCGGLFGALANPNRPTHPTPSGKLKNQMKVLKGARNRRLNEGAQTFSGLSAPPPPSSQLRVGRLPHSAHVCCCCRWRCEGLQTLGGAETTPPPPPKWPRWFSCAPAGAQRQTPGPHGVPTD